MTEALLLSTTRVSTFAGQVWLTASSGFFFRRDRRLYLVTSRHVFFDEPSGHFPDRVEIVFHTDTKDLTRTSVLSVPLYAAGQAQWKQGTDSGGAVDVAAIELVSGSLPEGAVMRCFGPENLAETLDDIEVGAPLLLVGFPLGFFDTVHHLPIVRQAIVASSFGVRFQGHGYFLTDARMHRGASGAPVVTRASTGDPAMPWCSGYARFDMRDRNALEDESLGLNCAWYADILMTLTQDPGLPPPTRKNFSKGARP
jgi:hypothetical protein